MGGGGGGDLNLDEASPLSCLRLPAAQVFLEKKHRITRMEVDYSSSHLIL